jgi:hypothetical protein
MHKQGHIAIMQINEDAQIMIRYAIGILLLICDILGHKHCIIV